MKRDERTVPFDIRKIETAIFKAAQSCGGDDIDTAKILSKKVVDLCEETNPSTDTITVEEVQNIVEKVLIKEGHTKTAKNYILYRDERSRVRELKSNLMTIMNELTFSKAADSNIKRENANIDGDTAMGTMLKYGSSAAKEFYELYVLDPKHSKAHRDGDIHIHDLDFYTLTTTCTQIDLSKLFKDGFSTGHGVLREPNDIQSYSALACIAIQSNQNDQHGGQSIPKFDYDLAEGVKKTFIHRYIESLAEGLSFRVDIEYSDAMNLIKDIHKRISKYGIYPKLSNDNNYQNYENMMLCMNNFHDKHSNAKLEVNDIKEIQNNAYKLAVSKTDRATYQAMEALIHNLNTMNSRAGAQTPFSSINYGTDTSDEGRMVIKNVLLATKAGLGHNETPIFPIQIFKVKEGVNYNPTDPNYDLFNLACEVSSKRLFPNFSFIDAPFNKRYYDPNNPDTEIAYMGCRTRVIGNVYDSSREIVTGRGNLSFTTINLPRLAIEANGDIDKFYNSLDDMMNLTIDQLNHRFKIQCKRCVRNYPFLMGQGVWIDSDRLSVDDKVEEVLKHGSLSVGFIGLAECLKALTGKHHGESPESQRLGLEIIRHMRKRMDDEAKKTKLNFTLLATPAESLSGRFVKLDREKYGAIDGITDRDYYTNSFHCPVYYPISAFEKIKLEAPYHELTNAGHISYIELDGDPSENVKAFEKIVRCMKESGIGYGAINHPVDRDPVCGYSGIIYDECPKCGRHEKDDGIKFDRIRRITGYLVGTLDRFNNAKAAEERDRVKHNI